MEEDTFVSLNDPLSAALMKIKLRAFLNVTLDAGGVWWIDFPALDGFTLNVVRRGECWLSVRGYPEKVKLRAGDCFLLTGGKEFTLANSLSPRRRWRAQELFALGKNGSAVCQGGGDFLVIGTIFRFEGHLPSILFGRLPPFIHVDGDSDQAAVLRWNLERFGVELRGAGMGRSLMLRHLAPIMLLQTLRIYLSLAKNEDNWLVALSHPLLSKALDAMQSDYQRNWSLDGLAKLADMSRSGFALMFRKKVGVTPMHYLKYWRMQIACELLQETNESLFAIAAAVGYGSESAFSAAFQAVIKCRPGAYRTPSGLESSHTYTA